MQSFISWLFSDYHWVMYVFLFIVFSIYGLIGTDSWKTKLKFGILCGVLVSLPLGTSTTYLDYKKYKNNFITCEKPAAVAAGYIYIEDREKCMKPFVGYVPVGSYGNIEILKK